MKIFKYLFIILALSLVFLSVYIATGKSEYELSVTKDTSLSNQRLFRYVENLQNFSEWNAWHNEIDAFNLDSIYKGKGAKVGWNGNKANITKVSSDTIFLNLAVNGNNYETKMFFKEIGQNSKITWMIKGNLSFLEKVKLFFKGTPESTISPIFKQGLTNINKNITESLKKFSIKNEGITYIPETIYIKQTVESNIENLGDEIFKSIEHMSNFSKNFELGSYGSPFTVFENINMLSGIVRYSVCLPIKNFFSTAEGSDIVCEKTLAFYGYKTVLTGDYVHSDKAWNQVKKEVTTNKLTQRADIKPIAIYKNSILNTQKSSNWITEFIIPVNETIIPIIDTPVTDTLSSTK